ncbi:MAG: hypothetical protein FWG77_00855 [Treponema sp.]|nr:hypothetical protein [Treponema sp.]
MFKENPYFAKSDIRGSLVVVLRGTFEDRGLSLIKPISRAVKKHEIHELIISDEKDIGPGSTVNKIAYLGFLEVEEGGVIISGDTLLLNDKPVGIVAGFDETHMPNHQNIVIYCDERITGELLGCKVGDSIVFRLTGE